MTCCNYRRVFFTVILCVFPLIFGGELLGHSPAGDLGHSAWHIDVPQGFRVKVTVLLFRVSVKYACRNVSLKVTSTKSSTEFRPDPCQTALGRQWISNSTVTVVLSKNKTDVEVTIFARYILEQSRYDGDDACIHVITSKGGELHINSSVFSDISKTKEFALKKIKCEWNLETSEGTIVTLLITEFRTRYSGRNCTDDKLVVRDGKSHDSPELGTYCGKRSPWFVNASSSHMSVYMFIVLSEGVAFRAQYSQMPKNSISPVFGVYTIKLGHGTTYPMQSYTLPSESTNVYQWHVTTTYGRLLQTDVTTFSVRKVAVYDAPYSVSANEIRPLMSKKLANGVMSLRYISTYFQSFMEIQVQSEQLKASFNITFSSIEGSFKSCGEVSSVTKQYSLVTLYPLNIVINSGSGGQCQWFFRATHVHRYLQFLLESLSLESIDNCAYEGLLLFDGASTSAPSYGPFCRNSGRIQSFVTSTKYLTILYYYASDLRIARTVLNASIEETSCKGFVLTEESTIFNATTGCYIFQRIPQLVQKRNHYVGFTIEPGWYSVEVTIEMSDFACRSSETFTCSEYIMIDSTPMPLCIGSMTSFWVVVGKPLDVYNVLSFVSFCSWSNAFFSAKVSISTVVSPIDSENECAKGNNSHLTFAKLFWTCGYLDFYKYPQVTYTLILGLSFGTKCITQQSNPSHYNLIFHRAGCDTSLTIMDKFYRDACHPVKVGVDNPVHLLDYLYRLRCSKNGFFQVPTIGADEVTVTFRTYYKFAIEFNLVLQPAVDVDNHDKCNSGYVLHRESCYRQFSAGTWADANKRCKAEGGELLSILDEDEYGFILECMQTIWKRDIYVGPHNAIFIGLYYNSAGDLKWTDNNPLTFTRWYTPGNDAPPYTTGDFDQVININKGQPLNEQSSRCTLMIVRNPYVGGSWFRIPCNYGFRQTRAICKQTARTSRNKLSSVTALSRFVRKPQCSQDWTFANDSCYRLVTSLTDVNAKLGFWKAVAMCQAIDNASIAVVSQDNINDIRYLLQLWKHKPEFGAIRVNGTSSSKCLIISNTSVTNVDEIWRSLLSRLNGKEEIHHWGLTRFQCNDTLMNDAEPPRLLNVLCRKPPVLPAEGCPSWSQMRCGDGTCISVRSICDKSRDCLNGEDEIDCNWVEQQGYYVCQDGSAVPISSYCDYVNDCLDGSDEESCTYPECSVDQYTCKSRQCISKDKMCDFTKNCWDGSDEFESTCRWMERCEQLNGFRCLSGDCIDPKLKTDLRYDCPGQLQEDEHFLEEDYSRGFIRTSRNGYLQPIVNLRPYCSKGNEVRCLRNHPSCFNRGQTCIFDGFNGCADNSHLKDCENFTCPGHFKCPFSYCIPKHRVCNGVWDCNGGVDEIDCSIYSCPSEFRCRGERRCLEQRLVCNGVVDCKDFGDDEKYCDLNTPCPRGCSCLAYILSCVNTSLAVVPRVFINMRVLNFPGNRIVISNSTSLRYPYLGKLDLSYNQLKYLPAFTFRGLPNLFELILTGNMLRFLSPNTFDGLALSLLDLRKNRLATISADAFGGLQSVEILRLQENDEFLFIDKPVLFNLNVSTLLTDNFRFCCSVKTSVNCSPKNNQFSSCSDMIANSFLRVSLWVLGTFAFAGNLTVFVWRLKTDRNKPNSVFLINLALSDLIMGLYMIVIASVDMYYVAIGDYYLHDPIWRNSFLCQLSGVLSFVSSEMSVYVLAIITIDRVIATVFVFKVPPMTKGIGVALMVIGWLVWAAMASLPFYVRHGTSGKTFYGETSVCLPFTLSTEFNWISVSVFLIFNSVSFLVVFVGYLLIYVNVKRSATNVGKKSVEQDIKLAKKLSLIVFTDFCCWVPITIAGFLSLSGYRVFPEFSAWAAVFIMPINSALNPYIYTLSSFKARKKRQS